MVRPETYRRHVEVGVLAWAELPGASHTHCDTERVAGKYLDVSLSATISYVAHNQTEEANQSLNSPNSNHAVEHQLLWAGFKVDKHCTKRQCSADDVAVQEHLVEGVPHWRWRLKQQECESNSTLIVCKYME
jgi:hypothetical protein